MNLLKNIKVIQVIIQTGSLSAAARALNMAPSGLSKILEDMETYFGYRLFHRSHKGLMLTERGKKLIPHMRRLLQEEQRLFQVNQPEEDTCIGSLRMTAPSLFGRKYVLPAVIKFMKQHPKLMIDLTCSDEIQNLQQGRFELAIRIGITTHPNAVTRKLAHNKRILVAAPHFLAKLTTQITNIKDLEKIETLNRSGYQSGDPTWHLTDETNQQFTICPQIKYISRGDDTTTELCLAGMGVALKSLWDVVSHIESGDLIHILPHITEANPRPIQAVYTDMNYIDPNAKAFADFFSKEIGTPPIWEKNSKTPYKNIG